MKKPKTKNQSSLADRVQARVEKMDAVQRRQSLVDAGILTRNGKVTQVYKPLFSSKT